MQKPLIGITPGEIFNKKFPWAPVIYGQAHTYIDSVIDAGGIPIVLPLTEDKEVLSQLATRLDGLLLSGGNDISPKLYGEEKYKETLDTSDLRDGVEKFMLDKMIETERPVLAICRGIQFLNVYQGGTLYQDKAQLKPRTWSITLMLLASNPAQNLQSF